MLTVSAEENAEFGAMCA